MRNFIYAKGKIYFMEGNFSFTIGMVCFTRIINFLYGNFIFFTV